MLNWIARRIRRGLDARYGAMLAELEPGLRPYRDELTTYARLPEAGRPHAEVLAELADLSARETPRWRDGLVSGAVYHGDPAHIALLNQAYALHSQTNPLHADLWPSVVKFEAEIVAMTAFMLGGDPGVCGTVTSGGTESILLAMKAYRDQARDQRGINRPEIVAPVTAHAAFDKAAQLLGMRLVRIPVGPDYRADLRAVRRAITRRTAVVVASAPSFPHGVIDPVAELAALARARGAGCHVDACLGGFVLPWAQRLGYAVPPFDFRVPGVTSMSADTHKYGYAAKGTSVILYRGAELRRYQYYAVADWPGGLYASPTLAGSRPGGLSAAAWAAMVSIGEHGYRDAARHILATAAELKAGIAAIPELYILGDPLWVIAFGACHLDIYRVADAMTRRGWSLNGLHRPPAIHLAVTLRHTLPGVAQRFLADLRTSVAEARSHAPTHGGMAPVYGMAATIPVRGLVTEMLKRYLDLLYKT